ncbi:1-(5-phosphoribosyl)-5-[(5-phosphoribosylamino) methylideneamino] imidazole-4-carboxamide isomerase [Clostridia bacterium]|nr:1-(5-phosphoribosyl)-5-[(5-phosphoribosylamino) methylideneamino] imidazole-4-carboxamide isomerase [Clostridia bacterium]
MNIYPEIGIKDGKCVNLRKGNFSDVTVYSSDPIAVAIDFAGRNASCIHIVDLDGARYGVGLSSKIVATIARSVSVPVQIGGGARTLAAIEERLSLGVARVILGTTAALNPTFLKDAVNRFGDKIVVSIDALNGKAATHGWTDVTDVSALTLCGEMADYGVKTIIYTDIDKYGMMSGFNAPATKEVIDRYGERLNVLVSGGVATDADVAAAKEIGANGVIIGKALYDGALDLSELIGKYENV